MDTYKKLPEPTKVGVRRRCPPGRSTRRHNKPASSKQRQRTGRPAKTSAAAGPRTQGTATVYADAALAEAISFPYFYTARQLGRQSPASYAAGYVLYCVDVNASPLHLADSASPQLVRSWTLRLDQFGARSFFASMSQLGELAYDNAGAQLFEMIHDGGCFEDGQMDDLQPKVHAQ